MRNEKQENKPGHVTNGDIFDDLSLSPHEVLEAKIKADIWRDLTEHIEQQGLDQAELKKLLKVHQPDVSNLLRGKISKFSTSKLITFAIRMDMDVRVRLTTLKPAKPASADRAAGQSGSKSKAPPKKTHA